MSEVIQIFDRPKFFAGVKGGPLPSKLNQGHVNSLEAILHEGERRGLTDTRFFAYPMATVLGECGINMQPVREGFSKSDAAARAYIKKKRYAYAKLTNGQMHYGRGFVQLTWYENYVKMQKLLVAAGFTDVDLINRPDDALRLDVATFILFEGMIKGSFRPPRKMATFFTDTKTDFIMARGIINGVKKGESLPDRAVEISGYARGFNEDLIRAKIAA